MKEKLRQFPAAQVQGWPVLRQAGSVSGNFIEHYNNQQELTRAQIKIKKKRSILSVFLLFCIFSLTIGQFIPIYFIDNDLRTYYYLLLFILLILTAIRAVFKFVYKPQEKNLFSTMVLSLFLGGAIFIFACIWMFGLLFSVWTEGTVYFIKKDNPKTKIISRYINEGAFGGGTEPSDYHIVLHRPILGIYKMETSIDTSSINKAEWINPN